MTSGASLRRVVSGGQTGADQAGLRAAKAAGIETGGWAPKGWATEDGPASWLAEYGLVECPTAGYPARTEANARDSDGTIWFGRTTSPGYHTTFNGCKRHGRPYFVVEAGVTTPSQVAGWINLHQIAVLNVAGNRESKYPRLGGRVEAFLARVFATMLRMPPVSPHNAETAGSPATDDRPHGDQA